MCCSAWSQKLLDNDRTRTTRMLLIWASQVALTVKEPACQRQCRRHKRHRFDPWVRKISWRKKWQHTPVLLPGESHEQRSLTGYSPWGRKESDTTEATEHTKHTGVDCHFLLQGIFPTQGLNLGLPHCRQTLYHLSHQGSPIEEAYLNRHFFSEAV